jgi:hypothetical protein
MAGLCKLRYTQIPVAYTEEDIAIYKDDNAFSRLHFTTKIWKTEINRGKQLILLFALLIAKISHIGIVLLPIGFPPSPNPSLNPRLVPRVILALIPSTVPQLWIKGSCNSM